MKKVVLLLMMTSIHFFAAQISPDPVRPRPQAENTDLKVVDQLPEFPGGIIKFRELIAKNIKTKKIKGSDVVQCELKFFVEKDGSISDVKTIGSNSDFNREVGNALSKIKQKWIPAQHNGQEVRYQYRIPLKMIFE